MDGSRRWFAATLSAFAGAVLAVALFSAAAASDRWDTATALARLWGLPVATLLLVVETPLSLMAARRASRAFERVVSIVLLVVSVLILAAGCAAAGLLSAWIWAMGEATKNGG